MNFKMIALVIAASAAPLALTLHAEANAAPIYVGTQGENIAVSGYDTVSYFQGNGVPVKGSAQFTVKYDGVDWLFSSQANADKFKENPDVYAPQYGGHCAFAMSRGILASGDPLLYKIVDGKLYLNLNKSVQTSWLKDTAGFIAKANMEWKKLPADARFGQ